MADAKLRVGMEGDKQFKADLAAINGELKTLGTETKAVTSAFAGNEKSVAALTAKNQQLEKSIEAQNQKLELLKTRLEQARAEGNEKDIQKYTQAVNLATADLNKMNAELSQNKDDLKKVNDEAAAEKWDKFAAGAKAAGAAVAAIGAAALAAVAALAKITFQAAAAADEINTMSVKFGISTDELQKFQYAAEAIDVNVETLTGSMTKLTRNMASAQDGSGAAADAFKALGVEIKNGDGTLRNRNDVFADTVKALGDVENATERDALAMQIFGKSAMELNPLILGGADALKELGTQAENAGLILSDVELNDLNEMQDSLDLLKSTATMAGRVLTSGFAKPIKSALDTARVSVERLVSAFRDGGWDGLAEELGTVISDALTQMTEDLPKMVSFGGSLVTSLLEGVSESVPTMVDSIIQTATEVINTASEDAPRIMQTLVDAAIDAIIVALDDVPALIDAVVGLVKSLAQGAVDAIPKIIERLPEIIDGVVDGLLLEGLPKLIDAGIDLFVALVENMDEIISGIVKAAPEIVDALSNKFDELSVEMGDIGANLLEGIWNGMTGRKDEFTDDVKNLISECIEAAIRALLMQPPKFSLPSVTVDQSALQTPTTSNWLSSMNPMVETPPRSEQTINITTTLDGEVVARNVVKHSAPIVEQQGASFVNKVKGWFN